MYIVVFIHGVIFRRCFINFQTLKSLGLDTGCPLLFLCLVFIRNRAKNVVFSDFRAPFRNLADNVHNEPGV